MPSLTERANGEAKQDEDDADTDPSYVPYHMCNFALSFICFIPLNLLVMGTGVLDHYLYSTEALQKVDLVSEWLFMKRWLFLCLLSETFKLILRGLTIFQFRIAHRVLKTVQVLHVMFWFYGVVYFPLFARVPKPVLQEIALYAWTMFFVLLAQGVTAFLGYIVVPFGWNTLMISYFSGVYSENANNDPRPVPLSIRNQLERRLYVAPPPTTAPTATAATTTINNNRNRNSVIPVSLVTPLPLGNNNHIVQQRNQLHSSTADEMQVTPAIGEHIKPESKCEPTTSAFGIHKTPVQSVIVQLPPHQDPAKIEESKTDELPPLRVTEFEELCPICRDAFKEQQQIIKLPCLHQFHCACIEQWFKQNDNCPMCRDHVSAHFSSGVS